MIAIDNRLATFYVNYQSCLSRTLIMWWILHVPAKCCKTWWKIRFVWYF